jgi:isopropylmalate/homocitrate/citramalate synthase
MIENIWAEYASCWSATPADAALLLDRHIAAAVVYRDPSAEVHGREQLADYMRQFRESVPGHRFAILSVHGHHDRSLARWELRDDNGAAVQSGASHALHDGDRRLLEITGYFGVPA